MSTPRRPVVILERPARPASDRRDDLAYVLPMVTFLAFTWMGTRWPALYPLSYALKTPIVAGLLIMFRRRYTPIKWTHAGLGLVVGVAGIAMWIALQLLLERLFPLLAPGDGVFDPTQTFSNRSLYAAFIVLRVAGATLLVPFMEELFWRDYLWRSFISPNDFKLAEVGEWSLGALLLVCVVFSTVHGRWFVVALLWGLLIGLLLARTKSLGACIIAHAASNLILAVYVLMTRDWSFW